MKSSHLMAGLTMVVLAIAVALWVWSRPEIDASSDISVDAKVAVDVAELPANSVVEEPESPKSVTNAPSRRAPKRQSTVKSLPTRETPFRDSVDALLEASLAGDSDAACRLVGETRRCMAAKMHLKFQPEPKPPERLASEPGMDQLDPALRAMALKDSREQYQREVERRAFVKQTLAACDGVDYSPSALSYYTIIAAEAGEVGSQLEYAQGHHLSTTRLLEDPQLLDQYRQNARRYFDSALETGDLRAISVMWSVSQSLNDHALAMFLPVEWAEPGFVTALIQHLTPAQKESIFSVSLDRYNVDPTAEQRDQADAFFEQYFAYSSAGPSLKSRWEIKPDSDPLSMTKLLLDEALDHCR